ncbi:MAG: mercury resistance protein [Candidatus Methylomirabilia bacterium]
MTTSDRAGQISGRSRSVKGYFLVGLAVVTCPCHLPLLVALLAGTGLAGVLSQYFGIVLLALSAIFVAALFLGLKALKAGEQRRS